jgi:hypothetical protein
MRRALLATAAVISVTAAVFGGSAAAQAMPMDRERCPDYATADELDENANLTGHIWIRCNGTWTRY